MTEAQTKAGLAEVERQIKHYRGLFPNIMPELDEAGQATVQKAFDDERAAAIARIAAIEEETVAPWRIALANLSGNHEECRCFAHEEARALLAPEGSEP